MGKCCEDDLHITNYGSSGFWSELEQPEASVKLAVLWLGYGKPLNTFNIREVIGDTAIAKMADMGGCGHAQRLAA